MHPDEQPTDTTLVRRLVALQFPQWADLPISRVPSAGTDNAIYRLGPELVVRLPRIGWAVDDVAKEQQWLPVLAPHLPVAVPEPAGLGVADEGYPWAWSVYRWIEGTEGGVDSVSFAEDLAAFVSALQAISAPAPRLEGSRGVPLADRDEAVREAATKLDLPGALDVWEAALAAPAWDAAPVWVHGDLTRRNLLTAEGRLTAVLDFGALNTGDPAVDLLPAWNLFTGPAREAYRTVLGMDDATWERGRGWAISVAMLELPYYRDTNPVIVEHATQVVEQLLASA